MKIGIVLYPTFGGSGVVATELGKHLAKKGYEIHFITYSQPVRLASFTENIYYHEVTVSDYPLFDYEPYETVLTSKLVDVVKHEGLNLLHVHYAIPHASAAIFAKQILRSHGIEIPVVTTLHGTDITLVGRDPSFEPVISYCINESDAVTAVSESLKADTYTHFHTTRDIEVIPNFIKIKEDFAKERQEIRERYAQKGEFLLCHISNFRKVKRVEDVVRIFKLINDRLPARLLLVGDGPERYKIEELCREMNTCDRVKFIGKVRDTEHVLEISDLFLLPSETESFGLAALEAMVMGVPVISTNTGGLPEVNIHGETGYLSDVGATEEMAANGIKILSDPAVQATFRKNAILQAKKFNIDAVVGKYEDLYRKLVARYAELYGKR